MKLRSVLLLALLIGLPSAAIAEPSVVVLGFDGADARITQRYMDEGLLPNLKALAEEGSFVWSDGEPLGAYENWMPDQPNDNPTWGSCEGNSEDCGFLSREGLWNDDPCSFSPMGNYTSRADLSSDILTQHEGVECAENRLPYICSKSPIPGANCSAA